MKYYTSDFYPWFKHSFKGAVKTLIIINLILFIFPLIAPGFNWVLLFGLIPGFVFKRFMFWQLFTYMFLHAGIIHLLFNMLMLWMFGQALEAAWGRKGFLYYYFFTGIGAALCSFITSPNSLVPVVGASGAIYGILLAYAMMYPDTIILLFFIFPMKIKYAIFIFAGLNLYGAFSSGASGIAYFAHLGGGLFGYLYLRSEWIKRKLVNFNTAGLNSFFKKTRTGKQRKAKKDLDSEVDRILDKISKSGLESLTKKERETLEHRSKMGQ